MKVPGCDKLLRHVFSMSLRRNRSVEEAHPERRRVVLINCTRRSHGSDAKYDQHCTSLPIRSWSCRLTRWPSSYLQLASINGNYAQLEKELLAIVYACQKFDQYIFGKSDLVVELDQTLLETIFSKPIHSAPARLQRMPLQLLRC